jgi:hypothetical protein
VLLGTGWSLKRPRDLQRASQRPAPDQRKGTCARWPVIRRSARRCPSAASFRTGAPCTPCQPLCGHVASFAIARPDVPVKLTRWPLLAVIGRFAVFAAEPEPSTIGI